jgi:hypothetical protein
MLKDVRVVLLALGLLVLLCGCATGDETGNELRVTREDDSRVKVPDELHAWCGAGPFESAGAPKGRELWIFAGTLPPEEEGIEPETFWMFSWPTKEIERSPRIELPETEAQHGPLFVYDAAGPNELSGSEEEAEGTVVVEKWGCKKGDVVRISVDATLGSEHFEGPTATAKGTIETVIGDPLPIPD